VQLVHSKEEIMKRSRGWLAGLLVAALLPGVAWAQWSHVGNYSVSGYIGAGVQNPQRGIHLQGDNAIFRMDRDRDSTSFMMVRTALGDFNTIQKAFLFSVNSSGVNNGQFTISDKGAAVSGPGGTRRFTIANDGRTGIGKLSTVLAGLHVKNPTAGNILQLEDTNGTPRVTVSNAGDLNANGDDLELRLASQTTGGYALSMASTVLGNTFQQHDEAFLALNGNTAILSSSGDEGLFKIIDQDGNYGRTNYYFGNSFLQFRHDQDFSLVARELHDADYLRIASTGDEMQFVTDLDNNTLAPAFAFTWFNDGSANANRRMALSPQNGNLYIKGNLTQNHAFDLAEAYWKSEAGIAAGDVVCIDPERPNAVVLARAANARAVVGVISTDPGIVMGGGAFSTEHLGELWGDEVAGQFAKQQARLEKKLAATDPYLQSRMAKASQMKSTLAKGVKAADKARLEDELAAEEQQIIDALETAALEAFCQANLALVALAGRVPVKVDAAYGAIGVGDLLVASATAGHAMRSENPAPGTVIGKALEPFAGGQGTIMMMVLNR
jgi:hypothetical protein